MLMENRDGSAVLQSRPLVFTDVAKHSGSKVTCKTEEHDCSQVCVSSKKKDGQSLKNAILDGFIKAMKTFTIHTRGFSTTTYTHRSFYLVHMLTQIFNRTITWLQRIAFGRVDMVKMN